jgi:hypothetical protein
MARIGTPLDTDDEFPHLSLALVSGGAIEPHAVASGGWCVLLVYRGHW